MTDITKALQLAGDYADSPDHRRRQANRDTMQVAAALDELYESKSWGRVAGAEACTQIRQSDGPLQADSRNRFAQWLVATGAGTAGTHPRTLHLPTALDGATIAGFTRIWTAGKIIQSEGTLRPLKRFLRYYKERIPDVWAA